MNSICELKFNKISCSTINKGQFKILTKVIKPNFG